MTATSSCLQQYVAPARLARPLQWPTRLTSKPLPRAVLQIKGAGPDGLCILPSALIRPCRKGTALCPRLGEYAVHTRREKFSSSHFRPTVHLDRSPPKPHTDKAVSCNGGHSVQAWGGKGPAAREVGKLLPFLLSVWPLTVTKCSSGMASLWTPLPATTLFQPPTRAPLGSPFSLSPCTSAHCIPTAAPSPFPGWCQAERE